ncbi:MAG: amidase [Hydrogenophaga sp.]
MTTSLHHLSATELLSAYAAKSLSPVEVVREVLAHIERCEPALRATYALDPEGAMVMARASEGRWLKGEPLRCGGATLDGVPATIKENIATRGVPMPLGTAATVLQPAAQDAPPAARLREAGAVFLGKTTMPEYGMLSSGLSSFHPLTRNPWNTAMNPGGSSAGAGAAAAAGYGPLHVGTDIGGSVRLPAAWCGVFGLKPSLGRIPIDPPYMGRCAGPMTRSVADAALMMAVLSQPDARDPMSLPPASIDWMNLERDLEHDLKGVRIGLWLDAGCGMPVDPQVLGAITQAAQLFEAAGATVEPLQPWMTPELLQGMDRFWRIRSGCDVMALPPERRDRILPVVRTWAEGGLGFSGEQAFAAYTASQTIRSRTVAATLPFDFVLSPVSPNTAFPAEWAYPSNDVQHAMDHIGFTVPFSMSEQPAASVACGVDAQGVPIGLQIAGRRFDDLGVLQMARAFEQLRPAQRPWPTVVNG